MQKLNKENLETHDNEVLWIWLIRPLFHSLVFPFHFRESKTHLIGLIQRRMTNFRALINFLLALFFFLLFCYIWILWPHFVLQYHVLRLLTKTSTNFFFINKSIAKMLFFTATVVVWTTMTGKLSNVVAVFDLIEL